MYVKLSKLSVYVNVYVFVFQVTLYTLYVILFQLFLKINFISFLGTVQAIFSGLGGGGGGLITLLPTPLDLPK